MFPQLTPGAIAWLAAGGVAYTIGALIYVKERPDPWPGLFGHHEVWHLCVLAGAGAHFIFTLGFVDQAYAPF
jgi:hemolysin III